MFQKLQKYKYKSKSKASIKCALDPSKYDNEKFWQLVYGNALDDVKNLNSAIESLCLPSIDFAFPNLDMFKNEIKEKCIYVDEILNYIDQCKFGLTETKEEKDEKSFDSNMLSP